MRRAPFVGAATVAGLFGVLSFHTKSLSLAALSTTPSSSTSRQTSPSTPPASTPSSPPTSSPATGGSGTPASGGTPPGSTVPPTTTAPSGKASATGPVEQYGYGELNVKVTVSGGRITNVSVPKLLVAESYSQQLAQQVIPMLRSQVLQAQNANINGVSGATYTSEAYAMSLQAALKQLHHP
ncbi:MAG: FMN-binding protein [Actinomycetota bacterium]|jgi:hypothetical protein|nr:FMN-binding protein [Actinomycetota bacterium]